MSNPTNNFSFDLDPYDQLAQMYGVGLFDLLPLPPSWANYVRAQYAPDPSLPSAPAPAIPGFRKLPDLMEAPAPVGSGSPGFDPLSAAPLPIGPSPSFPSGLPDLDKAIARINAPTPSFHLTPGLGGFTQSASGPALSLPPLPPTMSAPSPLILANGETAAPTNGPSPGVGVSVSPIGTKAGINPYAHDNAPLNDVDTTGLGSLAMNPSTGPRRSNSGIQLANGDSAGAVTIGDTPSGADLTAASQGFQAGASYVRFLMGLATGLGPAAMSGDLLRALDRGHSALDALILRGASGIPTP
ncbi:MAG: hypothetical protein J0H44_15835 [Alphaproteobacteria bacterium]|nr:hypothetical protein [Alphaproteobacteria bacterium]